MASTMSTAVVDTADAGITAANVSDSSHFVNDLMNGQPILGLFLAAVASGDAQQVLDVPAQAGYNLTSEGINQSLKAADPGPDFEIRMVAGLYKFDAPTDLRGTEMTVDSTTGRLSLNGVWVGNTTDRNGNVVFNYSGHRYSLIFTVSYDSHGIPNPTAVSGGRRPSSSDSQNDAEPVQATQVTAPVTWPNQEGWMEAGMIFTVFGGAISLLALLYDKYKNYQEKKTDAKEAQAAKVELEKVKIEAEKAKESIDARKAFVVTEMSRPDPGFNIRDQQQMIEEIIHTQVGTAFTNSVDGTVDLDMVKKDAAQTSKDSIRDMYLGTNAPTILSALSAYTNLMTVQELQDNFDRIVDGRIKHVVELFNSGTTTSDWIQATTNKYIAQEQLAKDQESIRTAITDQNNLEAKLAETRAEIATAKQKKTEMDQTRSADPSKVSAEDLLKLEDEISTLDFRAMRLEQNVEENAREQDTKREAARDHESARDQAATEADKKAGEVFEK